MPGCCYVDSHASRRLVCIVDRKKDQINAGGYKVWPSEVEDVLCQHEACARSPSSAGRTPPRSETVKANVSLRPGKTATPGELIDFGRDRMAAYKHPRQVEFLAELPKTVSGKLLRRELRDRGQLCGLAATRALPTCDAGSGMTGQRADQLMSRDSGLMRSYRISR